ncbi:MAG: YdeI/OmpD-associated family protein [Vulcanimicrobiaceae bacterium]
MNTKISADAYFAKAKTWQKELKKLRAIIRSTGLKEEVKWGKPTYTFDEHNVVILVPLKDHLAVMFCKGALLKDSRGLLQNIGQSQANRWMKFDSVKAIGKLEPVVKSYIRAAVKNEQTGKQVKYKETAEYPVPDELKAKLSRVPSFKKAFDALTPGRQRGYLVYFAGAKQAKTREARIEKCTPMILKGKGLYD